MFLLLSKQPRVNSFWLSAYASGERSNIKDNQTVQGIYAFNKQDFQRSYIHFKRLPKLAEEFNKLKKDLSK